MRPVVIIGGGITGSLIAYFLARANLAVVLVEGSGIGNGASGHNPGGINPLHGPGIPGPMSELALYSHRLHLEHYDALRRDAGMDSQFHTVSRIEVALDDAETMELGKTEAIYNTTKGFSAQWLSRERLKAIEPGIGADAVAGLLLEGNLMVDSQRYTRAAAQAARTLGARFIDGTVTGFRHDGVHVNEVLIGESSLACEAIVIANGAWSEQAGNWLGCGLPVTPAKGELLLVEWHGPALTHHITRSIMGVYALPGNRAWLGGTRETVGFDTTPTARGHDKIIGGVACFMPAAREARVIRHTAALRPMTPDGLPILGRMPHYDNAYVATGGGAKGVLLSIGMADILAKLIAGNKPAVPIDQFRPGRFQKLCGSQEK